MFGLEALFGAKSQIDKTLTKDKIAKLLSTDPSTLEAFEKAYAKASLNAEQEYGYMNAKTMAYAKNDVVPCEVDVSETVDKIVKELVNGTRVYRYDGNKKSVTALTLTETLPAAPVTPAELQFIPDEYKPELTGNYMKADLGGAPTYTALVSHLYDMKNTSDPRKKKMLYDMFRQGLDILDLDPVTYEMLGMNRNAMGNWLPNITAAVEKEGFFRIPNTTIVKVPMSILQLTRLDYMSHTRTTLDIVDKWAQKVFELDPAKNYFIKTGTYSSKFDFRNAKITDPKEVMEIGEYLLFIHSDAIARAGYDIFGTGRMPIYGMSTTNEWVVRDFIEDEDDEKLCIYHGLPLHTEYRVFVDFDTDEVLGIHPYWDPDVMKKRFGHAQDSDDPDMVHDYITYSAQEAKLMQRYEENKDAVVAHVRNFINNVPLTGQWSIDIMQNGDKFWLIDMAVAENSAFYAETVPVSKRLPSEENWLPKIEMK